MPNPKDTNKPVTDLSPQLNTEQPSKYLMERSLNKSTHYPGCHKVHLECANKKIDEAKEIIIELCNDPNCGCENVKWLESLGEK